MLNEFTDGEIERMWGITFSLAGDVLTVHFSGGATDVWTVAPPGYPLDGSYEVMRFGGRYFIPPPEGATS